MTCKMSVRCATYAGATSSAVCGLCQAGTYGTVSGEWMWTDIRRIGMLIVSLHLRGSRRRRCTRPFRKMERSRNMVCLRQA